MNRITTFVSRTAAAGTVALAMVGTTLAADIPSDIVGSAGTDVNKDFSLKNLFQNGVQTAVNAIFFLAAAAAIAYLIWAGVKYITAGGDPKKATEARQAIINAVIGIAVIVGAYTLISVAFGINKTVKDVQEQNGAQTFTGN